VDYISNKSNAEPEYVVMRWLTPVTIGILLLISAACATWFPLWIDEIFTYRVARLGSPSLITAALMQGVDGSPPLYALAASVTMRILAFDLELGVRLPSLIAFAFYLIGVLRISKMFFGGVSPLFCVVTAGLLRLDTGYTARPYAFALCFSAWMVVHLLDAIRSRKLASWLWSTLFFALAVASQYYCIFLLVPVAILVIGRRFHAGHWEWRTGSYLLTAGGVLALHYPLITVLRGWTKSYWSKPGLNHMFQPETLLVAIALAGIGFAMMSRGSSIKRESKDRLVVFLFLLTLASLPLFVVPLIRITTNAFVDRYLTFTVIGLVGILGWMLDGLRQKSAMRWGVMTTILLPLIWQAYGACQPRVWLPRYMDALTFCKTLNVDVLCPSTCVVTEASLYQPEFASFLAYPLDQQAELIGASSDTSFRIMKAQGNAGWLRTAVLSEMCVKGKPFAILTDERLTYEKWVTDVVLAAGCDVREVAAFQGAKLSDGRSVKVLYVTPVGSQRLRK